MFSLEFSYSSSSQFKRVVTKLDKFKFTNKTTINRFIFGFGLFFGSVKLRISISKKKKSRLTIKC